MSTHRWFTLGAAIIIAALEVRLFSATWAMASPPDAATATAPPHGAVSAPPADTEVPAGSSSAAVADANLNHGQSLYSDYCATCHQANGMGVDGAFPPLKGSGVVNRLDATKHIDVVLSGLQGARASGVVYTAPMPAFGSTLSDAAVAAIVDYERSSWGNHGKLIGPAQVANERARLSRAAAADISSPRVLESSN